MPNLNNLFVYDGLNPSIGILLIKSPSELNIPIASAEYGATLEFINDSYIVVLIIVNYLFQMM
jgi:hypothetical protein